MKVNEYLMSDIEKEYDDYSVYVEDEEGSILYCGDKYDLITSDEFDYNEILKVEENKKEKYIIFLIK